MTRNEIEDLLNSAYFKGDYEYLFKKAENEQDFFMAIWEIAREMPFSKAWRLLWILDHATEKKNTFIFPILNDLYQLVLKTNNESYIRQSMKLILRCPVVEEYAGELLDRCVGWMNDPKSKISSQVLGLEYFFKTCQLYPEMAPELLAHIDDIMERSPSAGYTIRLNQIRKQLEN
jgi:hypothetical protein